MTSLARPVRTAVLWQLVATVVIALLGGWLKGPHGAISAALGGAISMIAGLASAWLAARSRTGTAGEALYGALRAEAVRIILMLSLVWLTLVTYKQVVAAGLIGAFIVTALAFTMAIFVRDR